MTQGHFHTYAPLIRGLTDAELAAGRPHQLLLDTDGLIEIFYAPFDHVNTAARVVIVGITPGPTQLQNGLREVRHHLNNGHSEEVALRAAKKIGAFSGDVFRENLTSQLDHWGMNRWLGIDSTQELFSSRVDLVHTTSLLRYPVFVGQKKYEGTPDMTRHPLLRRFLIDYFVKETAVLSDALFVGLGPKVWKVLDKMAEDGLIERNRVINGVLHGSPENTYRVKYMTGNRSTPLPWKTNPEAYDRGRKAFGRTFLDQPGLV